MLVTNFFKRLNRLALYCNLVQIRYKKWKLNVFKIKLRYIENLFGKYVDVLSYSTEKSFTGKRFSRSKWFQTQFVLMTFCVPAHHFYDNHCKQQDTYPILTLIFINGIPCAMENLKLIY